MTPLRLAYVQSHLFYGSVEAYLRELIVRLDRDRFEPWLVCPDHPALEPLRRTPELEERTVAVPSTSALPSLLWTRARALRAIRPALVHCADLDPSGMLAARGAARRLPLVVTYNTPELRASYNALGRAVVRAAWAVRPWVIFTSGSDLATGIERDPIARERAEVIPYGVDLDRFAPRDRGADVRAALGVAPGRRVVGTVGLLREQKGHTYLLQAAELLERERGDVDWIIVGEGELRARLEQETRARGLAERVHFLGLRDDVPELLSAFDVFALSSTFEGMCYAVAEALAVEVPVVATDVGGVGQSVVHQETGLLVQPRDPRALAESIARLLDDRDEAVKLARAGRARVQRLYALSSMVEATESFYLRTLGRSA
jgi:glycosyltransferase involved in cell wall biosynthesis